MTDDLTGTRRAIATGTLSATDAIKASIAAAGSAHGRPAFLLTDFDRARAAARAADRAVDDGRDPGLLAGLAISVKDLFDLVGDVTTAGSTVLADSAPALADAPAVARLRAAGAALIGRTHMSEFAFSGVGLNPHAPLLANPATLAIDATPRVPGGSTSGGAVSVAVGAAWAALGSDTGGSIRIPAALQGLVGFKSTARLVPTDGAVPLSTTLDTVSAITRSVRDAVAIHEILSARRVDLGASCDSRAPLAGRRFAVVRTVLLDELDPAVAAAFDRAISVVSAAGAAVDEIALPALNELTTINAGGGFAPAESWAWHRHKLALHGERYDPRVAARIRRGEAMSAADYIDLLTARSRWIPTVLASIDAYDAILSPTVPVVAPAVAPLADDDVAFFATNALLLRNPSAVNFLDGCAISIPCHAAGSMPVGLMLWHGALRDDRLLACALGVEQALEIADR